MCKKYKLDYISPIGIIEIEGTEKAIISIMFKDHETPDKDERGNPPKVLLECFQQLDEYFKGNRHEFTFQYAFEGTEFQKMVWNALVNIKYANTSSYKEIAEFIGNEKAIRAVGNANGKNKLSIVIPCHRIIGSNGNLTGYAGGIWRKKWLLEHEKMINKGLGTLD